MRKNKNELINTREYKRIVHNAFFIIKPLKWFVEFNLTSTESDVLGIILAFQNAKNSSGWYRGGVVGLQVYLYKSRDTIKQTLDKLVQNRYLIENDGEYKVSDVAVDFTISNISVKVRKKEKRGAGHFADERTYTDAELELLTDDIATIKL